MDALWNGTAISFRVASPDQTGDVLSVLDEAAAWLQARGIRQWPARFSPSWIDDAIRQGQTWLAESGGTISATVTLTWSDPLWNDIGGSAAYLHRMAVRRQASGLGGVILAWAADLARQHGRAALRLDCVASSNRLRAYYQAAGFIHRGDVTVAGTPGQRLEKGPTTLVSRYELPLNNHL